jgi:hypothetical protein
MRNATAERNGTLSQTAERDEISGSDAKGSSGRDTSPAQASPAQAPPALDARYGEIGISAVAAAARYQGTAKNPAYAPTSNDWRWRLRYAEELT